MFNEMAQECGLVLVQEYPVGRCDDFAACKCVQCGMISSIGESL